MQSLYLIGFMGSGKTTVAVELAEALQIQVLDTDQLIEEESGKTIPQIFSKEGEASFRELEMLVLKKTPVTDTVIATGGGIIERGENRDWLKKNGLVIFLETSWDEIQKRLIDDVARPLWNNQSTDKKALLDRRVSKYKEVSDIIVQTDGKNPTTIVKEILSQM
ncbi:shikimate kinase [Gracilibacillus marinus]|uniref:Shikimate kinase n=1 Tax=Gracilibacillus marinus TaxID=630535 RepID=A0ABV8VY18_9BACI